MEQIVTTVDDFPPTLLMTEVEQVIRDAAADGGTLRIGPHAKRLCLSLAAIGISEKTVTHELIRAAARAGIPIEIDSAG
jgi:hypothetical protein